MASDPAEDLLRAIGLQIYRTRLEKGISQKTLAESAGMSQQKISLLEKGRGSLDLADLRRIASGLRTESHLLVRNAKDRCDEFPPIT